MVGCLGGRFTGEVLFLRVTVWEVCTGWGYHAWIHPRAGGGCPLGRLYWPVAQQNPHPLRVKNLITGLGEEVFSLFLRKMFSSL